MPMATKVVQREPAVISIGDRVMIIDSAAASENDYRVAEKQKRGKK